MCYSLSGKCTSEGFTDNKIWTEGLDADRGCCLRTVSCYCGSKIKLLYLLCSWTKSTFALAKAKLRALTIPTLLLLDCLIIIIIIIQSQHAYVADVPTAVQEQSLTLLPFSGLHLHPVLQSNPAQGSSIFAPCRNKEKKRQALLKMNSIAYGLAPKQTAFV